MWLVGENRLNWVHGKTGLGWILQFKCINFEFWKVVNFPCTSCRFAQVDYSPKVDIGGGSQRWQVQSINQTSSLSQLIAMCGVRAWSFKVWVGHAPWEMTWPVLEPDNQKSTQPGVAWWWSNIIYQQFPGPPPGLRRFCFVFLFSELQYKNVT